MSSTIDYDIKVVTVQTKDGPVEDEVISDKNCLKAAKSLGALHVKSLKSHNEDAGGVMLTVKDQNMILDRLIRIVCKQAVTLRTKSGLVDDEVTADKNSIAAAKLIIGLQAKYLKLESDLPRHTLQNVCRTHAILTKLGLHCQFCPQFAPSFFTVTFAGIRSSQLPTTGSVSAVRRVAATTHGQLPGCMRFDTSPQLSRRF